MAESRLIVIGVGAAQQAKLYLRDPSNYVIEIKAYRDFAAMLSSDDSAYNSNPLP